MSENQHTFGLEVSAAGGEAAVVSSSEARSRRSLVLAAAVMAGVFALDLAAPSGVVVWLGYLIPIVAFARVSRRSSSLALTAVCSVLVVIGYLPEHPGRQVSVAAVNACLGILAQWVTFALLMLQADDQEALRDSERRFQLAMDAADEGLWDRHLPTNYVYRSPRFYSMLGYAPGEIPESFEGWSSFLHPDDREAAVRKANGMLECEAGGYEAEYRVRAKDGGWRWIRSRGKVIERNAQGRVVRTMGTHVDITDGKRMEQERSILGQLAVRLAASGSVESIVRVVREETAALFAWDAHYFAIQNGSKDGYRVVSYIDTVNGQQQEFPGEPWPTFKGSPVVQRLLAGEPVLYNRPADTLDSPMNTFGDSSRLSASIMTVAVCSGTSVIGALSVQSYTQNRYNPSDLQTLQRVADTLAPALERAYAEEALRQAHNELEMRVWQRTADLMETNRTLESEIATRKRIENVLEEREKSLSMLMRNLPGAAYRCRNDHGWTPEYISEGIHALTGYAWSDFVREAKVTYGSLIHPEDRQMVWSKVQEALASRVQYTIEYRIQDAAGQERWVWERGQGIAREGEAAVGLEGFLTDITDRKHAEEALRHSEERFRFAMEATRDGLWDWDIRTDVAYFSPGYYRMLGYEPNQFSMTGQMWLDLIHPDDRERTLKANMECIENRTTAFEVEFRMRTIAGEWKWILGRGRAISRDAGGRAIRVIGTHVDTTERKQTEELLRTSEAKYRTLVQNIPGMVYRAYPDWTAEIISNAETLCGYTGDEVNAMEHGWLDIIHPEDRDAAVRDGAPWRLQAGVAVQVYRIIAKSGQVKWVEDHKISLFSESGSFMGIDGVVLDITGRKQTEQALRRSRRDLARLSRDREKLLEEERIRISRHLHDELGQSLTFLMLELSRFEKRVQESDPALSEELKQTCGQAKRMIESVRTIARSLRPIAIEHDGLVPSLRSCVEEFQRVSGVACRFVCRLPDARIGEPVATALYRIVQECLTNVVRHANASRCHIQLTAAGAQLELRIQDDGKGANVEALHGHESLGIVGMKERASAVGGKLLVKNRIPSGVLVKARFPLALAPPIHE